MEPNDPKVIEVINKIAKEHSGPRKKFAYFTSEDIFNEIWVICLEQLHEFDGTKGELERFLRVTVRNRLVNKFKDITKITKSPCPDCPFYKVGIEGDCRKFGNNRHQCDKWSKYQLNKATKESLVNSHESKTDRTFSENKLDTMLGRELIEFVKTKINNEFRRDFEELVNGGELSKQKFLKLQRYVKELIEDEEIRKELISVKVNGKDV